MPIQISPISKPIPAILERLALSAPRQKRAAGSLLPLYEADVARENYSVALFNEKNLQIDDFKRTYGSPAKRIDTKPSAFAKITMNRYTIEASVDRAETEGAQNVIQSSLLMREERLQHAYNKLMNAIETQQVQEILNANAYGQHAFTPENGKHWNEKNSDPIQKILEAKDLIKMKIGVNPNTFVISEPVWKELRLKTDLLKLLPNTYLRAGLTPHDLAEIIGIEDIIIADGMAHDGEKLHYIWGDHAVLAYKPKSLFTLDEPSFGITVRAPLGYHSIREYFDEKTTSDITAIDEKLGWTIANYQAGFIFSHLLTPSI